VLGVLADLSLLGWFKYADFVAHNVSLILGPQYDLPPIILPLAISFFTFQKLAYLIDSARGETNKMSFVDFSLFAAFFPQLIAGPIVHYREVVPQLQRRGLAAILGRNLLIGLVMFAIGLFKKTVIADTLAIYSSPLFEAAAKGEAFNPATGWIAAITFTFQTLLRLLPATPTWPSTRPHVLASSCRSTSTRPLELRVSSTIGGVGT